MPSPKSARRNTSGAKKASASKSQSATSKKSAPKKVAAKAPVKKSVAAKSAAPKKAVKKAVAAKSPARKSTPGNVASKNAAAKKAIVKKAVAKKAVAKKAAVAKKIVAKKTAQKAVGRAAVKKAAVKKSIVKKAVAKKAIVKKALAGKAAVRKAAVKKAIVKKAIVKKAVAKKAIDNKAIARKAVVKKAVARKAGGAIQKAAGLDSRGQLERLLQNTMSEAIFAQKRFQKIIGKLVRSSSDSALKDLFLQQQGEIGEVLKKLESAFAAQNWKAKNAKSPALEGILQETEAHIAEYPKGEGLDAALMAGSKKFRLFESGTFAVLSRLAKLLGRDKLAQIFELLRQGSELLESKVNTLAEGGGQSDEQTDTGSQAGMQMKGEGSDDSQAGEDSSSHVSGNADMAAGDDGTDTEDMADEGEISWTAGKPESEKDAELIDGDDRDGDSETGEPMGY